MKNDLNRATDYLNGNFRPWYKRHPIATSLIFLLSFSCLSIVSYTHYKMKDFLLPNHIDEKEEKVFLEKFSKDLEIISSFKPNEVNRRVNFQSYLNKNTEMLPDSSVIKSNLEKKLKAFRDWDRSVEQLKLLASSKELTHVNLQWLSNIHSYDHWNFFTRPELALSLLKASKENFFKRIQVFSSYKMPNMKYFGTAVLIRFLQLIAKKDFEKADALIFKAAQLLRSTHSLVGHALGSHLLKRRNFLIASLEIPLEKTPPRTLLALKRIAWGWTTLIQRFNVDQSLSSKWQKFLKPGLGMCAGAVEYPMGLVAYSDYLYPKIILEPDFNSLIDGSRSFMRDLLGECGLNELLPLLEKHLLRAQLTDSNFWQTFGIGQTGSPKLPINPAAIPFARRLIALHLHSVATPMFHQIYLRDDKN